MKHSGPVPFLVSFLLHVGVFLLAFISWTIAPKPITVTSVPVEIVSRIPSRAMAEAPVDALAVKTPEPIPQPEPTPPQPPPPVPTPPQPVPVPQKAVTPPTPKPVKTPLPAPKPDKTPPDKNGLKKPTPPAKPVKTAPTADDLLKDWAAMPSKAPTRAQAVAATRKTTGVSADGAGPADAGEKTAMDQLGQRLQRAWILNCDVPGSNMVNPKIRFTLSPNGRVLNVEWVNRQNDPVWQAGASLAMAAVNKGQPYEDLPPGLYNRPLNFTFLAETACRGH